MANTAVKQIGTNEGQMSSEEHYRHMRTAIEKRLDELARRVEQLERDRRETIKHQVDIQAELDRVRVAFDRLARSVEEHHEPSLKEHGLEIFALRWICRELMLVAMDYDDRLASVMLLKEEERHRAPRRAVPAPVGAVMKRKPIDTLYSSDRDDES